MTVDTMKSSLASKFAKDKVKEESGVWADFGDGIKVCIRRFKSKPVSDARARLEKPWTNVIRAGGAGLPPAVAEELLTKLIAEAVITGWEGITQDGKEIRYDSDTAFQFLTALPDFRDEVLSVSVNGENYKAKLDADAEGNS